MNYLVIYPGRFHPFHLGHKASYDWLANKFGADNVYIATSPFSYSEKVAMMTKLGVPAGHIAQVKNPYRADEIINQLSPEEKNTTALIFAVSQKDAERFSFKPKKDGSPSYLQPLPEKLNKLKPMTQHGYVVITPKVNFRVKGVNADSASAIRKLYTKGNEADRSAIITDLYGSPDAHLKDIFDRKLGQEEPGRRVQFGAEVLDGGETPVNIMHEHRCKLMAKITEIKAQLAEFRRINLSEQQIVDYIDEKK